MNYGVKFNKKYGTRQINTVTSGESVTACKHASCSMKIEVRNCLIKTQNNANSTEHVYCLIIVQCQ